MKIPNVDFCPRWGWGRDKQTDRSQLAFGDLPLEGYLGTSYTHRPCLVSSSSRRSTVLAKESNQVIPELLYVLRRKDMS